MIRFNGSSSEIFKQMAINDHRLLQESINARTMENIHSDTTSGNQPKTISNHDSVELHNTKKEEHSIKPEDASNDGKFSGWEATKNFGAGIVDTGKSIVTNIIKHPIMSTVAIGVGIALCANPIGAAVLAGTGVALAAWKMIPALFTIATTKNGDDVEKAFREIGQGTAEGALSLFGASAALKGINGVKTLNAVKGAETAAETTSMLSKAKIIAGDTMDTIKNMPSDFTKAFKLGSRVDYYLTAPVKAAWKTGKTCWQEKSFKNAKDIFANYGEEVTNGIRKTGDKLANEKAAGKTVKFSDEEIAALQEFKVENPTGELRSLNSENIGSFLKTKAPAVLSEYTD